MSTTTDRVNLLIYSYFNGNVAEFAKGCGINYQTLNSALKRNSSLSSEILEKISVADFFKDLNMDWLISGSGKMEKQKTGRIVNAEISEKVLARDYMHPQVDDAGIPYFPNINASAGMNFLTENGNNYHIPIRIPNIDAEAYINVFGDSMYPKYCSGDIIGIKKIEKEMIFFGHAYVIEMIDGEAYIKYIDPGKDDDHWMLRSENPHYRPKQFHLSKIKSTFAIKAIITKTSIL